MPVLAHPACAELLEGKVDETIDDGDVVESGELRIEALHTPGHCADHLALKVDDTDVLTADVLFKPAPSAGPARPAQRGSRI